MLEQPSHPGGPVLAGSGILITGASHGLGKAIAQACLNAGASLAICGRDGSSLEQTAALLRSAATPDQRIIAVQADVSRPEDADRFVAAAQSNLPAIHGIVNNAGISGPKGLLEDNDWQAWIDTVTINLLGTVYLCRRLLPIFRAQSKGKIVNLSGGGATAPMPRFSAYAASKAAVVRFTETLAHETLNSGIDVNAVAPGALNTRLLQEVIDAGPQSIGERYFQQMQDIQRKGGAPLEKASALCVYLLSSASDGLTGRLLSAVWDPWPTLENHFSEIATTDIYTLRRIVPKDRGKDWGDL